jgi:hypothetical protein
VTRPPGLSGTSKASAEVEKKNNDSQTGKILPHLLAANFAKYINPPLPLFKKGGEGGFPWFVGDGAFMDN